MKSWRKSLVAPERTLRQAMELLEAEGLQVVLVADAEGRLKGLITDGDIRRGLLNGLALEAPVSAVMNPSPVVGRVSDSREHLTALLRTHEKRIHHLPLLDEAGRIVELFTVDDIVAVPLRSSLVVLLAGGRGTRLRPLTEDCPKPMLRVGGRPILETIIGRFQLHGLHRFRIAINYLGAMIEDYFGDGARWGAEIEYLRESQPLGTAGPVKLLAPRPDEPFFVMNGDLLTTVNFDHLMRFHQEHKAPLTMCVSEHAYSVPYGVAQTAGVYLRELVEKPRYRSLVNAGIYVADPDVLDLIPPDARFDMTELIDALLAARRPPAVFPLHEYWVDVGEREDYNRAIQEYGDIFE
ncbi:MAG TPA: nucleotidyltransferase family protein [Alphaproteobacteria bacterium]|nr:nucleotidyltransferase family protein [Alphaproteobacteria bacterium]